MSSTRDQFRQAYELFKNKKFTEALAVLARVEQLHISSGGKGEIFLEDVYILQGAVHFSANDLFNARTSFEKALKANPYSAEACMGLGKIFLREELYPQAKTMFEWAARNEPENNEAANALKEMNILFEEHHHLPEEIAEETPLERDPLDEAYELFNKKDYVKALEYLTLIQEEYEAKLAAIENFKGFNYLALQDAEKAQKCFETAIYFNPETSQGYAGLGEICYLAGNDTQARTYFERAIKFNPHNEFAIMGAKKTEPQNTEDLIKKTKQTELENFIQDAYADFSAKRYQPALDKLEKAEVLALEIGFTGNEILASILNFKGFNYLGLNDLSRAKHIFEQALKTEPSSSQACAGLGEIYFLINMDREAKTMYELAVKHNGNNQFASAGLVKVNKALGLPENHNSAL